MDQLPKPEDTQKDHNTVSEITLAPDSDLMIPAPTTNNSPLESVLPPLPTTPSTQTISNKVSFDPPQNWGTHSPDATPSTSSSTTSPVIANPLNTPVIPAQEGNLPAGMQVNQISPNEESTSISIIKIFLISLGLILLGVLLGVLAAKFFQPAQINNTPSDPVIVSPEASPSSIVSTPIIIPTPTATPEALLKLNWKNFTNSNYKLFYPSAWVRKSVTGGVTLTKGTNIISLMTSSSSYSCDKHSVQGIVKDGYLWDLQEASVSSQYYLCETTDKGQSPNTSIGSVKLVGPKVDSATLDEFKYILEKIEIVKKQTTSPKVSFVCPSSEYIDCMPTVGGSKKNECSPEAMAWYTANCPNFKGGAL